MPETEVQRTLTTMPLESVMKRVRAILTEDAKGATQDSHADDIEEKDMRPIELELQGGPHG